VNPVLLTDIHIRNLKPEPGKKLRLFDAVGLYLEVSPTGRTYWRLKYRYGGKEKVLALGVYPETNLKDARLRRDDARKLLSTGVDRAQERKKSKLSQIQRS
jgi:Arm domain-containing DNA-binding protein